jgi:transposase
MALVSGLTGVFHLAKDDVRLLIKDLYDIDISDGSVINIEERVAKALAPTYEGICQFVTESDRCKHFDETSWRDCGQSHYVWIACTKEAVSYRIDRHRSKAAFMAIAGNLNPSAPVVTDRYGVYRSLKNPHQYCIPHLIRDFRRYSQRDGPDGAVGLPIEKELQKVCHIHRLYREKKIFRGHYRKRIARSRKRLIELLTDGVAEGSSQLSDLCCKLLCDDFHHLWVFHDHAGADPSNNLAERHLRRLVLWRKKSYGTRSARGQAFVATISSVSETLRRNGVNILGFLTDSVERFYRGQTAPLMRPEYGF